MSILDGLWKPEDLVPTGAGWYNAALDDVREALTNPTDEQVDAIVRATVRFGRMTNEQVRAVLAAAAGGDDE